MKICIIGPSGVGKTTISQQLSCRLNITNHEFDDIYWDLSSEQYIKNSQDNINHRIQEIIQLDQWIMEGAYDQRLLPFFQESTTILRIKIPYWLCAFRLIIRFLDAKITHKKPIETWKDTVKLLKFSKTFDRRLDIFFQHHPELSHKMVIVKDFDTCIQAIRSA
ncbi:NB-ARC domain-containing protein [Wohlfahrtiimonas larvae]|uniref:DNA topology modulation protein FlaR n=1 Tax=Wohlfahrtiimonas larvae TaxID=1157986 RepID=A0ABP9MLW7_9GAMM|nr:AAA family ATPase [Wohlfahrtiimonas larvae]